eukprot:59367-Prorocentrum_minimum.AAC.7
MVAECAKCISDEPCASRTHKRGLQRDTNGVVTARRERPGWVPGEQQGRRLADFAFSQRRPCTLTQQLQGACATLLPDITCLRQLSCPQVKRCCRATTPSTRAPRRFVEIACPPPCSPGHTHPRILADTHILACSPAASTESCNRHRFAPNLAPKGAPASPA